VTSYAAAAASRTTTDILARVLGHHTSGLDT
jgi:hypothetical protein